MMSSEARVGVFTLITLVVIGFITLMVGSRSFIAGGGYDVHVILDNAIGVRAKTPVEIAGIKVGQVKDIELEQSRMAKVTLTIDDDVILPVDSKVMVRAKGFLGEIVIELVPGTGSEIISDGHKIDFGGQSGDVNLLLTKFTSIADDIKAVSSSLRNMAGNDTDSPVWNIVKNLEQFTNTLAVNQENFNRIAGNFAELSAQLHGTVAQSRENVEESIQRIASITRKVDEGKGTVGRLVNDETTVNKLNEAVDNLNGVLGGLHKLDTEIGYHLEYLADSSDFKNYVNLTLKPRPDKAIILDFVQDEKPFPDRTNRTTTITTAGGTSTVSTETATVNQNQFRFSAQLAKSFYDFTVRGGIIESRGGFGLDYNKGPFGAHISAYNFNTDYNQRPQLKASGTLNVTNNFYVIGGAYDLISKQQDPNLFMGAGIRLADDDVKSLFGLGAGALKR